MLIIEFKKSITLKQILEVNINIYTNKKLGMPFVETY